MIDKTYVVKGFTRILFLLAAAWLLFNVVPGANYTKYAKNMPKEVQSEGYDSLSKELTALQEDIQQAVQREGGYGDEEEVVAAAAQRAKREEEDEEGDKNAPTSYRPTTSGSEPSIPFFFVHINKTGGTSLITMLSEHCTDEEYVRERWRTDSGYNHRSFHSTAHSYIERHGRRVWDRAYTFAVVRHPLARQVSNFFFLVGRCEENPKNCVGDNNDRIIPNKKIKSSSTEEEKIDAFHEWMWTLYRAHPSGSPQHHLFGSKGHGNEEYPTMNATQTSWLVDETGQEIVVKTIFKLEDLSDNMKGLSQAIPCLGEARALIAKNQTPKYPHYSKFAKNDRTNRIMQEVFAVDYVKFGYDLI